MCNPTIVLYPEIGLRSIARDVVDPSANEVRDCIAALKQTMDKYSHCVGLAANQIGSDLNIFVADARKSKSGTSDYGSVVVINPVVISTSGWQVMREGCMSVPDLTGNVARHTTLVVDSLNESGEVVQYSVKDFEARIFQHEIDHLSGKVFLDRVKSARDVYSRKQYDE